MGAGGSRARSAAGWRTTADGLAASGRPDLDPFYFRGHGRGNRTAAARAEAESRCPRCYVGVASGDHVAAKQRQIYLQGADPLQQLDNPFLRSRGSLLVGEDFHYHSPGGAGVRGIDPRVSAGAVVALNLELEQTLVARPTARLFNRVALAAFTDLATPSWDGTDSPADRIRLPRRCGRRAPSRSPDRRHQVHHPIRSAALCQPAGAGSGSEPGRRQGRFSLGLQLRAGVLKRRGSGKRAGQAEVSIG